MSQHSDNFSPTDRQAQLLGTLEQLLDVDTTDVNAALGETAHLLAVALATDKIDIFLYDDATNSLIARGVSDTPMGQRQRSIGLDRQPLANGGRAAWVFQTGESWSTGHADQDPEELPGITQGLGVRSELAVPLEMNGARRGALVVSAAQPDRFWPDDLPFVQAVTRWVGIVLHRAELVEQHTHDAAEQARRQAADQLVTIVAHDLRTPLTALRGHLELLHNRAVRENHQRNLKNGTAMLQVLTRVERMITDLLDSARLDQGIFTVIPESVDLAALVRETVATVQRPDDDMVVRAPDELCCAVDPQRIRQALENLLANARTHTQAGTPVWLEVETEHHSEGTWAVVAVHDSGPGIPPELLPRLFTRFAAGQSTHGLGLGLHLAWGIATAHGGTLTVDSKAGHGTTFRLAVPLEPPVL